MKTNFHYAISYVALKADVWYFLVGLKFLLIEIACFKSVNALSFLESFLRNRVLELFLEKHCYLDGVETHQRFRSWQPLTLLKQ